MLNLRYPTVGESSGTLLRSLGLGKAVMVSEIGSFQEFPDDVCLKVPVGAGEEDLIFEYLNLLVSRPEVARALGERAQGYVATECNWERWSRAVRGVSGSGGEGQGMARSATMPSAAERASAAPVNRGRDQALPAHLGAQREERAVSEHSRNAPGEDARNHAAGRPGQIACSKWAPICRSRPRSKPSWVMARCAAATTASWAAPTSAP